MSFDNATRNRLAKLAGDARTLLTAEFFEQCRSVFGITASGQMADVGQLGDLDDAERATATLLRERVDYLVRIHPDERDSAPHAITQVVREQAFTILNRLAALRMAEKRGLITESVGKGYQSKGFKVFETVAGTGLGDTYRRYRQYLHCLFDELALDLGVFDRRSPQGMLFPRESALLECLTLINAADVDALWAEDETIGWIYQYYNDPTERKRMREESPAPRNARELAIRNQFFTPRYVVAFLTDNTLGRIWYEMTRGTTRVVTQCRFLVRRPTEVFLADPMLAFDRIFGKPEDEGYSPIPTAYRGSLSDLPADDGPDSRWISVAIPPGEIAKITGEPYEPFESDRLGGLIHDIIAGRHNPDAEQVAMVWAACSRFCLTDGGGAYSREPWQKLWAHFRRLAQEPQADDRSRDELLREPAFIPHRPLKDPRNIRMLDPACGSMHFGLYAFDLFQLIYDEAWDIARDSTDEQKSLASFSSFVALTAQYRDKSAFLADVPRLIIEHNIHGVDIDPRAAQIAGLSLWLRAQRAWQEQSVRPDQRPQIRRSNIVCAEPMPGDEAFLNEFIETHLAAPPERKLLGQLVRRVFNAMNLAGEAGSLLKIEDEIAGAVSTAKQNWLEGPRLEQARLFAGAAPSQQTLSFDVKGITDETFWENAEERIYAALNAYAEQAERSGGYQRRLFANDAARGFAFIDIFRRRYDVVLMNPPFGEPSTQSTELLRTYYGSAKSDIDAAFVDRAAGLLVSDGTVGGIYNRTQFFKGYLEDWRDRNLIRDSKLTACADLGYGVLDGALVEAAAYVTSRSMNVSAAVFISALANLDKERTLNEALEALSEVRTTKNVHVLRPGTFNAIPGHRISYWIAPRLLLALSSHPPLEGNLGNARQGLITADNDRFLRLVWEIPPASIARALHETSGGLTGQSPRNTWVFYAKGGDYSPFYGDVHLVVNWRDGGNEIRNFFRDGSLASRPQNLSFYFRRALTYTERTASDISPRAMPDGCIFDCKGPIIAASKEGVDLLALLALTNTKVFKYYVELSLAAGDSSVSGSAARQFTQSIVGSVPVPVGFLAKQEELANYSRAVWSLLAEDDAGHEESRVFVAPHGYADTSTAALTLAALAQRIEIERDRKHLAILDTTEQLDAAVIDLYGLDQDAVDNVEDAVGRHPNKLSSGHFVKLAEADQRRYLTEGVDTLIAELVAAGHTSRAITKMSFYADRRLECLASAFGTRPADIVQVKRTLKVLDGPRLKECAEALIGYGVGVTFGRWDVRYVTGEVSPPPVLDPFTPLPLCPPGQLQNAQMLPIEKEDLAALETKGGCTYPIDIPWDGILVDDPGHPLDIEARLHRVLQTVWKDRWEAIEREACEILGLRSLRDYFRRPAAFFADHLKRYSNSRRQAPIYWPLSTAKGNYTLWIYYHRLTDQTLHAALADFVEPKIRATERALAEARAANRREAIDDLAELLLELQEFRGELERLTRLPWKPNLNDGVLISASPLWKLFRLPKWQRDLKSCWEQLAAGEYDWAHLALSIWPKRVKVTCEKDRSTAIAHDLEPLFNGPIVLKKPGRSKRKGLAAGSAAG